MAADVPRAALAGCQTDGPAMILWDSPRRRGRRRCALYPECDDPAKLSARYPAKAEHRAFLLHDRHPGA